MVANSLATNYIEGIYYLYMGKEKERESFKEDKGDLTCFKQAQGPRSFSLFSHL